MFQAHNRDDSDHAFDPWLPKSSPAPVELAWVRDQTSACRQTSQERFAMRRRNTLKLVLSYMPAILAGIAKVIRALHAT